MQRTERVSVGPGGAQGNGHSRFPVISDDGRYVAFASSANNLVDFPADTNGIDDIFVRDRCIVDGEPLEFCTPYTQRVSLSDAFTEAVGIQVEDRHFDMTPDGRFVVFDMRSTNLPSGVPGSHSGAAEDVFIRDLWWGTTKQLTFEGEFNAAPKISADGRWVVFQQTIADVTAAVLVDVSQAPFGPMESSRTSVPMARSRSPSRGDRAYPTTAASSCSRATRRISSARGATPTASPTSSCATASSASPSA